MKSIRFNDLSKASQIFAESFVEKEPKIKSRKSLNEGIKNKPLKENYSIVDLETGERFGNFNSVESAMNKAQRYSQQCSATCAVVYSGVFGDSDLKVICGYKNGKERRVTNEALSDEAKANNEMIQRILNKKPSQLTAKEKKFLADNDLVRDGGRGNNPSIGKKGALWYNDIEKGDRFITNHSSNPNNRSSYKSLNDVDQLNLLNKRDERMRARIKADEDPDILAPERGRGGMSRLQDFNNIYSNNIKGSKRYAKNARDFMDSYIETGGRLKADLARHNADASRVLKDQAKKSLEHRPKFESLKEGVEISGEEDIWDLIQSGFVDEDMIIDFLSYHDTAFEDICKHFNITEDNFDAQCDALYGQGVDNLIDWITDHTQLWYDFCNEVYLIRDESLKKR